MYVSKVSLYWLLAAKVTINMIPNIRNEVGLRESLGIEGLDTFKFLNWCDELEKGKTIIAYYVRFHYLMSLKIFWTPRSYHQYLYI